MATLRIEKVDGSLPGTLSPDTLYFVKNGSSVSVYISDSTGSSAFAAGGTGTAEEAIHPFLLLGASNA